MKICVNSMLCLMARPQIHLPNVKTCLDVVNTYSVLDMRGSSRLAAKLSDPTSPDSTGGRRRQTLTEFQTCPMPSVLGLRPLLPHDSSLFPPQFNAQARPLREALAGPGAGGRKGGSVGIRPPSAACSRPGQPAMAGAGARGRQNRNDRLAGIRRPRPQKPVFIW